VSTQTEDRSAFAAAWRRSLTSASSRAAKSMRSCCISVRSCWASARSCWLSARWLTAASWRAISSTVRVSSASWPATAAMSSLAVTRRVDTDSMRMRRLGRRPPTKRNSRYTVRLRRGLLARFIVPFKRQHERHIRSCPWLERRLRLPVRTDPNSGSSATRSSIKEPRLANCLSRICNCARRTSG
jgi:hypothetical protein